MMMAVTICCLLELRKHGYAFCMQHFKLKSKAGRCELDKVYLVGGAHLEPNQPARIYLLCTTIWLALLRWLLRSNKVYHLDLNSLIPRDVNDGDGKKQIIASSTKYPYPGESREFLEFSTIKKLVFRLNKDHSTNASYHNNEQWFNSYDIHPMDACLPF
ncbi:hypothetical protein RIF29_08514 [Crotalaria pallida]|uniref:Uncharacterized protein n=1 Tax=Crotalaria pallida TaxID=3830 RepID=A0AAN9FQY5_CROPI